MSVHALPIPSGTPGFSKALSRLTALPAANMASPFLPTRVVGAGDTQAPPTMDEVLSDAELDCVFKVRLCVCVCEHVTVCACELVCAHALRLLPHSVCFLKRIKQHPRTNHPLTPPHPHSLTPPHPHAKTAQALTKTP